jgi:co-chaperonin GroES (HSP10)
MDPFKVKPLGNRLLLHKCENDDVRDDDGSVLILLPDQIKDTTNFCKVLDVGPKCKNPWPIGATVRLNHDYHQSLTAVPGGNNEVWLAAEDIIDPVCYG